jgi:ribonuclease Y
MEAHHFDVEFRTLEAQLVQAADALSAARPGARREILETYVKRLEKLENLADSFEGVSKCYALQAGRELRIMVESDKVSDEQAFCLTRNIARKIENELQYPGQIKVTGDPRDARSGLRKVVSSGQSLRPDLPLSH